MAKLGEHADKAVSIKFEHLKKPGGLAKRHYRLANRAAKYVLAGLERPWPDSDAMRFGKHPKSASSVQPLRNSGHGLWGNARAAVGLAILSKVGSYDPSLAGGASREEICRVAQAIIKYVALSHSTQDPRFTCDVTQYRQFKEFGPEWGLSWQSPAYAAELALGAWLLWEHLSPDVRTVVNNILTAEVEFNLDRPTYLKMPGRCNCDPNVWTGLPNAYAVNMLPEDARCDTWGEDMFRWMFNSFGLPEDLTSNHIVDARPLKERMEYASLNEDCTMENHGFFHPQYLHIYNLLQQAALPFGLAGNPIPEVIGLHRKVIFERIKSQVSWEGHFFYSNGFDWRPFAGAQEMGAWMHMLYGDADGAALEKKGVESKEVSMNRFNTGAVEKDVEDVESDGHNVSSLGSSAKLYLGHCLFLPEVKPTPWEEMNCAQIKTGEYPHIKMLYKRTERTFCSWSSGPLSNYYIRREQLSEKDVPRHAVCALVTTKGADWVLAPGCLNLKGEIEAMPLAPLPPEAERWTEDVVRFTSEVHGEDFTWIGEVKTNQDCLLRRYAFVTLPKDQVLYVESLQPLVGLRINKIATGQISIFNEDAGAPFTDNKVELYTDTGKNCMIGHTKEEKAETIDLDSRWFNIDNILGLVPLASKGVRYLAEHRRTGRGLLIDRLITNFSETPVNAAPHIQGQLSCFGLLILPGHSAEETARVASTVHFLHNTPLRFSICVGDWTVSGNWSAKAWNDVAPLSVQVGKR